MTPVERAFVIDPPSELIARELNRTHANVCTHDRSPCYLRCGVEQDPQGVWHRIPTFERVRWLRATVASYSAEELLELNDGQPPLELARALNTPTGSNR